MAQPRVYHDRRNAAISRGGKLKETDDWHRGKPFEVVSRNFNNASAIHFFPDDGVGVGVALTECMRQSPWPRIVNVHKSIVMVLPPDIWARVLERPRFLYINWPGYQHLRWKHKLTFTRPDKSPCTIGEMGYQVASIWDRFIREHGDDFQGPGVRLGQLFVSSDCIRLHEIYSTTGHAWQAEVSYMLPT